MPDRGNYMKKLLKIASILMVVMAFGCAGAPEEKAKKDVTWTSATQACIKDCETMTSAPNLEAACVAMCIGMEVSGIDRKAYLECVVKHACQAGGDISASACQIECAREARKF